MEIESKKVSDFSVPQELTDKFKESKEFKKAFEALTAGRQKGYILNFSEPKQSKTRVDMKVE